MVVTLTSLAVAAGVAVAVLLRASRMNGNWKQGSVLVPTLLVAAIGLFCHVAITTPLYGLGEEWNGCRLAPVVSLTKGYSLYYPPTEGPILNLIYGPLTALVYFPVLAFRSTESMVMTGVVISLLLVAVPLFVCHWRVRDAGSDPFLRTMLAFLVCFLALSVQYGTQDWYRNVHADAPALGLGLLACASLLRGPSPRSLLLAGLCTALSLFTKQTAIGLAFGLAVWLWLAHGRGPALRYGMWTVGLCAAFGLLSIALFGFGPLYFNTITLPSRHAWQENAGRVLFGDLMRFGVVPAAILIPGIASLLRERTLSTRPWSLLLLVALFMIPTSLLGRVKLGGEPNSLHCVLYLYAAASLSLLETAAWPRLAIVSAAVLFAAGYQQAAQLRPAESFLAGNVYRQADDFRKSRPGEVYFPTNPLCTLLAESKLYHFDYGVYDRTLAGFAPSPEHLRAHLPPRLKYVAWFNFPPRVMADRLPEFQGKTTLADPSLYGWTIYVASR